MNIKIVVEDANAGTVRATLYASDTSSNIGTLWVTREEFDQFVNCLTFGMSDNCQLEIEDPTAVEQYTD